ncbi:unnamed protein product [Lampetra planeri]
MNTTGQKETRETRDHVTRGGRYGPHGRGSIVASGSGDSSSGAAFIAWQQQQPQQGCSCLSGAVTFSPLGQQRPARFGSRLRSSSPRAPARSETLGASRPLSRTRNGHGGAASGEALWGLSSGGGSGGKRRQSANPAGRGRRRRRRCEPRAHGEGQGACTQRQRCTA